MHNHSSTVLSKFHHTMAAVAVASVLAAARLTAAPLRTLAVTPAGIVRNVTCPLAADENDVVIKAEELPQVIRDYVAKEMPNGKITEARKDYKGNKEKTGDHFTFEVEVKDGKKEYELKFAPDGKFLKKRELAGDEPDDKK